MLQEEDADGTTRCPVRHELCRVSLSKYIDYIKRERAGVINACLGVNINVDVLIK
jgi:hypothetical protein